MLGNNTSLSKFKRLKLYQAFFSDHILSDWKSTIRKTAKNTNKWKLNNMLLKNKGSTEEIKREILKYEQMKMKTQ